MNKDQIIGVAEKAKDLFQSMVGKTLSDKQTQEARLEEGRAADRKAIRDVLEAAGLDQRERDRQALDKRDDPAGETPSDEQTQEARLEEGRAADRKAVRDVLEAASLDQRERDRQAHDKR